MVLTQPYTAEEVSLQSYALIRRYTEWKSERKEEIPVMVGKLKILHFQRTVEWEHKRIPVVKREFDFLYLLATTPGRVYTYSQIYQTGIGRSTNMGILQILFTAWYID